jgi:CheY-like chemotaxis protein
MSRDLQPKEKSAGGRDDAAIERYGEWRDACAAVDDAYCEWLCASPDELPGAFAEYQAALARQESVARSGGAVIDRLTQVVSSLTDAGERSFGELSRGLHVLIADRDGFARRVLQGLLEDAGEIAMVTPARDGREALELACRYPPDVLLVDIGLPPSGGVELIRKVVSVLPRIRIVTVSAAADWDLAVSAALRAGAVGHIDKDTAADEIARLIVLAAGGETIAPRRLRWQLSASLRLAGAGG